MSDEKPMGQVIQIDEARIEIIWARWFVGRWNSADTVQAAIPYPRLKPRAQGARPRAVTI